MDDDYSSKRGLKKITLCEVYDSLPLGRLRFRGIIELSEEGRLTILGTSDINDKSLEKRFSYRPIKKSRKIRNRIMRRRF